jgi:hypothetical protein
MLYYAMVRAHLDRRRDVSPSRCVCDMTWRRSQSSIASSRPQHLTSSSEWTSFAPGSRSTPPRARGHSVFSLSLSLSLASPRLATTCSIDPDSVQAQASCPASPPNRHPCRAPHVCVCVCVCVCMRPCDRPAGTRNCQLIVGPPPSTPARASPGSLPRA